jgi:hypothetical protein
MDGLFDHHRQLAIFRLPATGAAIGAIETSEHGTGVCHKDAAAQASGRAGPQIAY